MSPELAFLQALNGISFGALLFILAAGLSFIFGMMDVVNLAHGAFYMLGAYVALSVVRPPGGFWVALVAVPLALGALGLVVEPLLLRRLRGRHLDQVLITVGVALVITDLIRLKPDWGAEVRTLPPPDALAGSIAILGNDYPVYRLFVIAFGVTLALSLAALPRRSPARCPLLPPVYVAHMPSALRDSTAPAFGQPHAAVV